MKRREFIGVGAVAAAWPVLAGAQQATERRFRVGLITPAPLTPAMLSAFRDGMRQRGYVEGQNLTVTVRSPPGPFEQNPGVVAEFVNGDVDVIVAFSTPAVV